MKRVALVTGATSLMGAATARAFAHDGYAVVLTARRKNLLDALALEITSAGGDAVAIDADITDADAIARVVGRAVETFGGLDAAFNNAGGNPKHAARMPALADYEVRTFEDTVRVNLNGTFNAMRAQIRAMLERGGGAIVNVSSTAGLRGVAGLGPYSAAKHAIIGLTKTAALDYAAQNIRINVVAPGPIVTEDTNDEMRRQIGAYVPVKRMGEPDDVAQLVRFLCSPQAQFITGTVIPIDGGQLAGTPPRKS
jgi:NAD(P)-dependent dehydrogenase (short-subunit alcohol dehydrogenase family)